MEAILEAPTNQGPFMHHVYYNRVGIGDNNNPKSQIKMETVDVSVDVGAIWYCLAYLRLQ